MNAINFLQQRVNSQSTQSRQNVFDKNQNKASSFVDSLNGALGKKDVKHTKIDEGNSNLNNNSLAKIIEGLGLDNKILDIDKLSHPSFLELMETLPIELQFEIEQLLELNVTLNDLLATDEHIQNPAHILLLLMSLDRSDVNTSDQIISRLHSQLDKLLQMEKLPNSLHAMSARDKEELMRLLQGEKYNFDKKQLLSSAFSRASIDGLSSSSIGLGILGQGTLNPLQQFVLHVGENRGDQQTVDQFIRQFQKVVGKSTLSQFPNGLNQLSIKLFPEHLGRLDVKLIQQNGSIVAQLMTTTQAAKQALDSQLHHLRQAFLAQNIQVEKIEITTQHQQQSLNQSDRETHEERNNQQQSRQREENDNNEEENVFQDYLEDEVFNMKI
ncbi:hypothetical protein BKP37_11690 [Anaerobacillus alkalilacustris]|uniref:Flagellar hook-length control protein-like C-terminal domain-containing protein n=1 Tax=Anaerobacillus alkalilacustris TaxID=393763 RepID=A0A1S2LKY8_9BACI|nr:flagellar hook-length control protein FliK [Anaerobacillus alkalilacustris]OIJ13162.1 hypothetical protein BKP37_11690 [Anaerobacillus alkalilacustris]